MRPWNRQQAVPKTQEGTDRLNICLFTTRWSDQLGVTLGSDAKDFLAMTWRKVYTTIPNYNAISLIFKIAKDFWSDQLDVYCVILRIQ